MNSFEKEEFQYRSRLETAAHVRNIEKINEVAILKLKDEEKDMIHQLAKSIATYFLKENIIEQDDMDTYIYGAEVLISGVLGIVNILLVSILLDTFYQGILFLVIFIPIRMYTGGYHASSYFTCNIGFIFIYILSILMENLISKWHLTSLLWILVLAGLLIIFRYAPLENANKKIPISKVKRYKVIGCSLYIGFMGIAIAMCMEMKQFEYIPVSVETGAYINIILVTIVFLFVIGMRKEGKWNEKENQ